MMSIPISEPDLVAIWGQAEIDRWAKKPSPGSGAHDNSDANKATAIAKGWSEIRSAALNKYSAASFDALTAETLPDIVKGYGVDLITDWLSSGNKRQPDFEVRVDNARKWLGRLATGFDHSLDGVVTALGASTGSASVRVGGDGCGLRFDRSNPQGGMARRVRGI